MSERQPEDKSDLPPPSRDWNELSDREVEDQLDQASRLADELAGQVGEPAAGSVRGAASFPADRTLTEHALDVELKQIEYLVDRARGDLGAVAESDQGITNPSGPGSGLLQGECTETPNDSMPPAPPLNAMPRRKDAAHPGRAGVRTASAIRPAGSGLRRAAENRAHKEPKPARQAGEAVEASAPRQQRMARGLRGTVLGMAEWARHPLAGLTPEARRALRTAAIAACAAGVAFYVLYVLR